MDNDRRRKEWQIVPIKITEDMANAMECQFSTESQWEAALNASPKAAMSGSLDRIRALVQARVEYWNKISIENFDEGHLDMIVGQFQEIANDIAAAITFEDPVGCGGNPLPVYNIPQID